MGQSLSNENEKKLGNTCNNGVGDNSCFDDLAALLWLCDLPQTTTPLPLSWKDLQNWTVKGAGDFTELLGLPGCYQVGFVPYVILTMNDFSDKAGRKNAMIPVLDELPSLSWMERAKFFSNSVAVTFEVISSFDEYTCCNLSLLQFCKVYCMIQRLGELVEIKKAAMEDEKSATLPESCKVCCHQEANVILPCKHKICNECESRWVRKHLHCPFCRTTFSCYEEKKQYPQLDYRSSGRRLPEVEKEIRNLSDQLRQFWVHAIYPNHEISLDDILEFHSNRESSEN